VRERERTEGLREALQDAINTVSSARKGSMGSIGNVYLPQIGVEHVERWKAALATHPPQQGEPESVDGPNAIEADEILGKPNYSKGKTDTKPQWGET
jgi:hypothetical protein